MLYPQVPFFVFELASYLFQNSFVSIEWRDCETLKRKRIEIFCHDSLQMAT